tara:strand:- start:13 stop:450 length:438 start_codon:yes stop_codon:yes gene_type:complete
MKSKFLYIIIGILIISNVYFLFNIFNKTKGEKNEEFKYEMRFLKKRLNFESSQLELAKKEFRRYNNEKKRIERNFRKYDLMIMNDLSNGKYINEDNKNDYYDLAISLNQVRINHWKNIREIANKEQESKLDSIWSRMKSRIESQQ